MTEPTNPHPAGTFLAQHWELRQAMRRLGRAYARVLGLERPAPSEPAMTEGDWVERYFGGPVPQLPTIPPAPDPTQPPGPAQLTPDDARYIRLALLFGVPDPEPPEIAEARRKLRLIEGGKA